MTSTTGWCRPPRPIAMKADRRLAVSSVAGESRPSAREQHEHDEAGRAADGGDRRIARGRRSYAPRPGRRASESLQRRRGAARRIRPTTGRERAGSRIAGQLARDARPPARSPAAPSAAAPNVPSHARDDRAVDRRRLLGQPGTGRLGGDPRRARRRRRRSPSRSSCRAPTPRRRTTAWSCRRSSAACRRSSARRSSPCTSTPPTSWTRSSRAGTSAGSQARLEDGGQAARQEPRAVGGAAGARRAPHDHVAQGQGPRRRAAQRALRRARRRRLSRRPPRGVAQAQRERSGRKTVSATSRDTTTVR